MKWSWPILIIFLVLLLAFFPVIFLGKIPLNGRNLVSFFSPWHWERFEGFPTGVPSKPGMLDQLRQFYPYMAFTQRAFRSGQLPLWNPYNFAGNPHAAEWQSSIYYPLQALLLFLPLPVFWTIYQFIGFFLAGVFTFCYLRNLKLSSVEATFGGITFMLSGFMSSWTMGVFVSPQTIIWLPLILLAIDKIVGWPHTDLTLRRALRARPQRAMVRGSGVPADFSNEKSGSVRKGWWITGLLGVVLSILAGFWQTTFYVMVVSVIYAIYRLISERKLSIIHYPLSIFSWFPLALLLTSFYVLPAVELFQRGSRVIINSGQNYQDFLLGYLLPFRFLVTLFAPDYFGHPTTQNYFAPISGGSYYEQVIYVGTIPLILFLMFLLSRKQAVSDQSTVKFWLLMSVIAGSFAFNTPWARLIFQAKIPLLSTSIPNRVLFIPAFGLSIIAAFGLRLIISKRNRRLIERSIFVIGAIAVVVFGFTRKIISFRNMVIPTLVLIAGSICLIIISRTNKKLLMKLSIVGLFVVNLGQLLWQYHKFTPFSEKQFIFPDHSTISWLKENAGINRFAGYNGKFLQDNLATYWGIYSSDGYDALNDRKRSQLLASSKTGQLSNSFMTSSDAQLDSDITNPRTRRLFSLLGVKYLVDRPEWLDVGPTSNLPRLSEDEQKLVFSDRDWKIWELLGAYPRAYLVGKYEVEPNDQKAIDRLFSADFNPRLSVVLPSPVDQEFNITYDSTAEARLKSYDPMKIVIETSSATDQLLFLSDTWYPGWWAKLENGKRLSVLTAFTALRAVPVPAGSHTVTMWYFPNSFRNGLIISLITFISLIAIISFVRNTR